MIMVISDKTLYDYIDSLLPMRKGELGDIQSYGYENDYPIIPKDSVGLMAVILGLVKPKEILELGTAIGFSACFMSDYLEKGGKVTTIDRYPEMIEEAKENIKRLGKTDSIRILFSPIFYS